MLVLAPQFISAPAYKAAVPAGAIVGYAGTIASIPTGWELCDGNNGTPDLSDGFVIGEDATYAYGSTGGSSSSSVSGSTGSGGSHTGSNRSTEYTNNNVGVSEDGAHDHTLSGTISNIPESYSLVYIMATEVLPIPEDAVVWFNDVAASIPDGYTEEINLQGRFAKGVGDDTRALTGGNAEDVTLTLGSSGFHDHTPATSGWAIGGSGYPEATGGGAHSDSVAKTFVKTLPTYHVLTAVRATGERDGEIDLVAAYFGDAGDLPENWMVCDGSNGTPDLAGRMILGADGSTYTVGDTGGSGSREGVADSDVTHTATHQHGANTAATNSTSSQHASYVWTHSHSIPNQSLAMPPWTALSFIMCLG